MTFSPALVSEEHPLEINEEMAAADLGLSDSIARAEKPVKVELTVQKDEGNFLVTGWATTTLSALCGRCGVWMPWPARAHVEHLFEAPHPSTIDLAPLIREDILLELPLNAACQLGPKGKCPITGEIYKPRPESTATIVGAEVWDELSKLKPSKLKATKLKPKK